MATLYQVSSVFCMYQSIQKQTATLMIDWTVRHVDFHAPSMKLQTWGRDR